MTSIEISLNQNLNNTEFFIYSYLAIPNGDFEESLLIIDEINMLMNKTNCNPTKNSCKEAQYIENNNYLCFQEKIKLSCEFLIIDIPE
jgi:hypothetical protein